MESARRVTSDIEILVVSLPGPRSHPRECVRSQSAALGHRHAPGSRCIPERAALGDRSLGIALALAYSSGSGPRWKPSDAARRGTTFESDHHLPRIWDSQPDDPSTPRSGVPAQPGESLDLGDRQITAFKPPTYNPATTGSTTRSARALFSSDSFGAVVQTPADVADDIAPDDLAAGQTLWTTIDSPWLHKSDRTAFERELNVVREMDPLYVLSSHLPPARSQTETLLTTLARYGREPVRGSEPGRARRYVGDDDRGRGGLRLTRSAQAGEPAPMHRERTAGRWSAPCARLP